MLLYQALALTKNTTILEYQLLHGMKSSNYLTDHILCQIFDITLNIS